MQDGPLHVLLLGASGTIGSATLAALLVAGHRVSCVARPGSGLRVPNGAQLVHADLSDARATETALRGLGRFDAVISCMASRSGTPQDAWAVDHDAHLHVLQAAQAIGAGQFVLLSAICVQRPLLAFQRAKLAFEAALVQSGLPYSIVRPTAFFKSLSGQVARVQAGKPFLLFGDGRLTACKPISDADLGRYLATCLGNPERMGRILPIGGPGPAITPIDQGEMLFDLIGRAPRFRRVPVAMMDVIIGVLTAAGAVAPRLRDKAELARIGRYYATESMLVWDAAREVYDADATPEFGTETLREHYARMLRGEVAANLGEHAVF
jgi:divinyl chlorophyllide a 8-vinyl-reductase